MKGANNLKSVWNFVTKLCYWPLYNLKTGEKILDHIVQMCCLKSFQSPFMYHTCLFLNFTLNSWILTSIKYNLILKSRRTVKRLIMSLILHISFIKMFAFTKGSMIIFHDTYTILRLYSSFVEMNKWINTGAWILRIWYCSAKVSTIFKFTMSETVVSPR